MNIIRTSRKTMDFGAFCPIVSRKAPALLRPNRPKIPQNLLALRSKIFDGADFWSTEAQNATNTVVLVSILTKGERKSAH